MSHIRSGGPADRTREGAVKKAVIAGVGNVLLGDDGVGPYVAHVLEHRYRFEEGVTVFDLGTPGLDLVAHLSNIDALIVVDSVANDKAPGTITHYRRADILRHGPAPVRMDPHSPSLSESLLIADFVGEGPRDVLLIGISGADYEPGTVLTDEVRKAALSAVGDVLAELDRLDLRYWLSLETDQPAAWWEPVANTHPA
jgi:hydrogenase maturation protease